MGVEGGMKCVKFLLFFFNFIFWVCGLALIVIGILAQVALHNTLLIEDASASGGPIVVIIVGVVIFFIAFFGCCGAWKENYCMVTTFAILVSLIILVEIAAAIAGYVFRNKLSVVVQSSLTEMISKYNSSSAEFRDSVDKLQQGLHCCGVNSSSDWRSYSSQENTVPDSCCIKESTGCGVGAMTDKTKVYQQGCHDVLEELLKKNILWVIVAAIVIAALQLLGVVFACVLMRGIRSGYEVM
ncbi:CD63 antigen [Synchiropus splendidus]|uniref:CD63 antigen n=1 Tax=Synchiropus splendidus TaxID=270530 RepID=UPI00237EA50E|nr:CD63 antigen [Synchiropus splendidus]